MTDNPVNWRALADQVATGDIKALSIKQPWPNCIFHEGKDIENRDWPTKMRGWFIVHASKTYDGGKPPAGHADLPFGGIVGMARIVDCVSESDSRWFFGKFGFVLRDAFPVSLVPCRGQLGFFTPPEDALRSLAAALYGKTVGSEK